MNTHINQKGIGLIGAIIVIMMVSIMLTGYIATVISERQRVVHEAAAASAEYVARAGLEKAFFDLSCEYDRDRSWLDDTTINGIGIDGGSGVPDAASSTSYSNDDDGDGDNIAPEAQSNYVPFYPESSFDDGQPLGGGEYNGDYRLWVAFVTEDSAQCPGSSCAFKDNRVWVKSTGRLKDTAGNTIDEVTLTQLAKVKPVKNITQGLLYDTLDYTNASPKSAVDSADSSDEIRVSGTVLDEDVTIADKTLTIRGGYGYDFSDGSRDTSLNDTTLKDSAGGSTVDISGAGTITMGGVRIE